MGERGVERSKRRRVAPPLSQSALSAQQLRAREAESSQRELASREAQLDRVTLRLQEEADKAAGLRQHVASMAAHNVKVSGAGGR